MGHRQRRVAVSWTNVLCAAALAARASAQQEPDDALAALQAGNQRFVADHAEAHALSEGARRTLARGHGPAAIVLCCADAQLPPELVFDAGLGELFVVRLAGVAVDADAVAGVEYAADRLGARLCVVLGHEGCGAIADCARTLQDTAAGRPAVSESPALARLLQRLEPAVRAALDQKLGGKELADCAEAENAQRAAVEVLRRSPLLQQLQRSGRLRVVPARCRLATGEVEWLPMRPLPQAPAADAADAGAAPPPSIAPHTALRLLQAGHRRFLGDGKPLGDVSRQRREALAHGQPPMAIVATCADARVAPERLFDAGLGDLFVVRVAGNVLDDDVLASLEYAATRTGASLLVVMGHTNCDAVQTAVEHGDDPALSPNLRALVDRLAPAVERARREAHGEDLVARAVRANVLRFCAQVRQQSRLLQKLEDAGRFVVVPAIYDLASGDIEWLDPSAPSAPDALPAAPAAETAPQPAAAAPAPGDEPFAPPQPQPAASVPDATVHAAPVRDAPVTGAPVTGAPVTDALAPAAPAPPAAAFARSEATPPGDRWMRNDQAMLIGLFSISALILGALATMKKR
jgi:carbonic anhydrase